VLNLSEKHKPTDASKEDKPQELMSRLNPLWSEGVCNNINILRFFSQ